MARFPSVEWFEEVARAHGGDRERVKRLGYTEANVGIVVEDAGRSQGFLLEFAGYRLGDIREIADPVPAADFTIAGPLAAWREMIEVIAKNGEPDLDHTLNRLTMAGTPLRLVSDDQLKVDLFFRFNQSFQAFFDASAGVTTQFPALAPA
ncbi:MAG: hypothetical protein HY873_03285 [Chloroflexi bacterium]|nr:hypothetical protein [Chloroflexota bacterium]